jgi:LPS sulfotransferase NodH
MHTDHWHVAPDGTVLSVKDSGTHYYKRSQIRKNIREITGISMEDGWKTK